MTSDLVELGTVLLGLFTVGWGMGFLIQAMRRFFDHV